MHFLERGWLSSNNLILTSPHEACMVDSGFWSHSDQTLQLVRSVLEGRSLNTLINTHLHSDHCGGNAALQGAWPNLQIGVCESQLEQVQNWETSELSYDITGQHCPRFLPHFSYFAGQTLQLSGVSWEVFMGAGHDPHSSLLFQKEHGLLITADALWQNGFGVVFPELEGLDAFEDVLQTLELIESLNPKICLPGHGPMFNDVDGALKVARARCHFFMKNPKKHAIHSAKVLIKYRLLELQKWNLNQVHHWSSQVPLLIRIREDYFSSTDFKTVIQEFIDGLVLSKVAKIEDGYLHNL